MSSKMDFVSETESLHDQLSKLKKGINSSL